MTAREIRSRAVFSWAYLPLAVLLISWYALGFLEVAKRFCPGVFERFPILELLRERVTG